MSDAEETGTYTITLRRASRLAFVLRAFVLVPEEHVTNPRVRATARAIGDLSAPSRAGRVPTRRPSRMDPRPRSRSPSPGSIEFTVDVVTRESPIAPSDISRIISRTRARKLSLAG